MDTLQEFDQEVSQCADARTAEVIVRLLERLEANVGRCTKHDTLLRDYTKAAICRSKARRRWRNGDGPAWRLEHAEQIYQQLREAYHRAVWRCGCQPGKYDYDA